MDVKDVNKITQEALLIRKKLFTIHSVFTKSLQRLIKSSKGLFGHARQPAEFEQRRRGCIFILLHQLPEDAAWPEAVVVSCCGGLRGLMDEGKKKT